MSNSEAAPQTVVANKILGVDSKLVERFLLLIRDNYQAAERAIFVLEERAGILSTAALTNLRDVLSHLSSMLEEGAPDEKRVSQLANAEEHMRRAIFDPYAIALGDLRKKYRETLSDYRASVLPQKGKNRSFRDAPDERTIRDRLQQIVQLAHDGRTAKGKNLWDESWEDGVTSYVRAFDNLSTLNDELSGYINILRASRRRKRQTAYNVVGVAGTAGGMFFGVLSVWMVVDPSIVVTIRGFFGLL
jgi:hypothetical protein